MEFHIGNVTIPNQTVLGPMAGVTDLPFRLLCKEQGAGLVEMEMISSKALTFHSSKTRELMETRQEEAPVALQLFGHEPEVMAEGAELVESSEFDILDINMGCPMPKIVNNGDGSALMKDPELIEKIVAAVKAHTSRPVTAKMRIGYDCQHINVTDCAKAAEAGGADAVTVHARTRTQLYSGTADWNKIAEVVNAVKIPVIGNGDVKDGPSAKKMLDETGCAAVMVARAAEGNPWIFREINHFLDTGTEMEKPSKKEVVQMVLRHAKLMNEIKGERVGMHEMRKHVAWYLQGFPGASRVRAQVSSLSTYEDLENLLRKRFPYAF